MTLPFAPDPQDSRIYRTLAEKKLDDLTPTEFSTLRNQIYAEGIDGTEDEYRRLLLLQAAANQNPNGAPLPNTMTCVSVTDTTGSGTPRSTLYETSAGQVYQLVGAEWTQDQAGAAVLELEDVVTGVFTRIGLLSGVDQFTIGEPCFVSYPVRLIAKYDSATGDNTCTAALIRVR